MYKFNNILICLDLTEADYFLINYTSFIANILKPKKLVFIHVMETYDLPDEIIDSFHDSEENLEKILKKELEERINSALSVNYDLDYTLVIEQGLAAEKIVQYSKNNDIDLSILSGKGSVAKKVAGLLPSSVLMVNEKSKHKLKKLLVKMDFSKTSYLALLMAQKLANLTGASIECHYVHKFPLNYFPKMTPDNVKDIKNELKEHVDNKYEEFIKNMNINKKDAPLCSFCIEYHDEESYLVYNHAAKNNFDLILTGTKIKSILSRTLLEKNPEKYVGIDKEIPIMIVKDYKKSNGFLKDIFD